MFSGAGALEENLDLLKVEDRRDIEDEVGAPTARYCGARAAAPGFVTSTLCLTKALTRCGEGGARGARACYYVEAPRARDLERFVEARDDLKRAAQRRANDRERFVPAGRRAQGYERRTTMLVEGARVTGETKEGTKAREKAGLFGDWIGPFRKWWRPMTDRPNRRRCCTRRKLRQLYARSRRHDPRYYDVPRAPHIVPPAEKINR